MNELAIKKHDFELAKRRLKEFSEKKEAELSIERVQTDGGFLWLGDHKGTGTELNSRLETIQNHLIQLCPPRPPDYKLEIQQLSGFAGVTHTLI